MSKETYQPSNLMRNLIPILLLTITAMKVQALSNDTQASRKVIYKTIHSEDGTVIDCVNIYKQPSFNHPDFKNHVIQMKPSSNPDKNMSSSNSGISSASITQSWHKNGGFCPKGTIPIARSQGILPRKTGHIHNVRDHLEPKEKDPTGHEHAEVQLSGGNYYGATANINLWNPKVLDNEFSTAEMWVYSGPQVNAIEAGWMVAPPMIKQPSLFTYWTRDEYQSTGCYNLDCPGFVQTSSWYALGAAMSPVSTYLGPQYGIPVTIHKDMKSGHWWLNIDGENIGYWPSWIFTSLVESSKFISWGGEVKNGEPNGKHTTTQMGSGQMPSQGWRRASVFTNVAYLTSDGIAKNPLTLQPYTSNEHCYNVSIAPDVEQYGVHFFYGGPGLSPSCQW
ncbi:hypothetical protein LINPERHAP2_LOCUS24506 [Linum perenne]